MHAEQLGRSLAEPVCLRAMLVEERKGVLAHRLPFRWGEILARRGVWGQFLDRAAPNGGGIGEHGGSEIGSYAAELRQTACVGHVAESPPHQPMLVTPHV